METKAAIQNEFLKEYKTKTLDRITVKELCAMTPVARTTFYSHYENVAQLLAEIEDELISGLNRVADEVSAGNLPEMDFDTFLDKTFKYVESKKERFSALLVFQSDKQFEEKLKSAIKAHFKTRYPQKQRAKNYNLISEMMASAVLGGYVFYLKNPDEVQLSELKRVITKTLDEFVKNIF